MWNGIETTGGFGAKGQKSKGTKQHMIEELKMRD